MLFKKVLPTVFLATALSAGVAGCGGGDDRLNILLVTLDTTRADHLHCYGRSGIETPVLDGLAGEGILFENGIVPAPLTLPSHASIMTGLTPIAHGARLNDTQRLGEGAVTLAELLSAQGYETSAFIGAFVLNATFGLAQGFGLYDDDFSGGKEESASQFAERTADMVTDAAIHWLEARNGKRPFFAWVHYFDPHMNYAPPSPFRERYAAEPYDGEIAFVDHELGRLVQRLKDDGEWEKTLIWVVGDHGEGLGEHGELSHSYTIYDALIRVPYIVSHPESRAGDSPRWRPRRVAQQVESIDILPTLADLLVLPIDHAVEGRSLLPLLDGDAWQGRPAYAGSMVPLLVHGWAPPRAVRTSQRKYIRLPRPELYDLAADPKELHNLAAERPDEVARMENELARLVERAEAARIEGESTALSGEEKAMLASLGYLGSDGPLPEVKELDPRELELPDPKDYVPAASQYLQTGITALMHQNPREAERLFREYLQVDKQSAEGRFNLALALRDQGRIEEALAVLKEAEERDPESYKVSLHMGILLIVLGRREEARPRLEKAIELNPYSGEPLFVLGTLMEDTGHSAEALDLYDRALVLDEGNSIIHMRRGLLLHRMGRTVEGDEALRRAVESCPRTPQSMERLARRLMEEGRSDIAQPLVRELRALSVSGGGGGVP